MWPSTGKPRGARHKDAEHNAAATRDRIMEAAEEVFAEKGYHGAIVDDIVHASDTSKGSFYFHFPNKQGIFLALIERLSKVLTEQVDQAIGEQRGGVKKVDAALFAVLDTFARHRKLARLMLIETAGLGQAFDHRLMDVHDRFAQVVRRNLDQAVADGDIPPLDTEIAAYAWLGAIMEIVMRWLQTGQPENLEDAAPALRELLLRSIGAHQADPQPRTPPEQSCSGNPR